MKNFKEIDAKSFSVKPIEIIGSNWMLVSAGTPEHCNTMTASWGGIGVMWGRPVAYVVIRPQRFTKTFVDAQERFSLSFPPASAKKAMAYLGSVSGKNEDKISKSGLKLAFDAAGTPYFEDAYTVLFCRKLFAQAMDESAFIDKAPIQDWYPEKDFHTLYIAEIEKILVEA